MNRMTQSTCLAITLSALTTSPALAHDAPIEHHHGADPTSLVVGIALALAFVASGLIRKHLARRADP